MKNLWLTLCASAIVISASAQTQLSAKEKSEGWHSLFDGQTTNGWHTYLHPTAGTAWTVQNGELVLDPKAPDQGDLVTDKEYENFELSLDWKISQQGNSGIIFGVHEDTTYKQTYLTGIEMQILDDKFAEDNKKPNHLAGSLYDMRAPAETTVKPAGEWNSVWIRKKNGRITFWLNGKEIINVVIGSQEWKTLLENSKFKNWPGFAAYPKGKIALQDHGYKVSFRNIKIREL